MSRKSKIQTMTDLKELGKEARRAHIPVMKEDGLEFLLNFIQHQEGIRDILEIGTAVGYSAMSMAMIRWDMQVDSLEIDPEREALAIRNIQAAQLTDRIHLYLCDGADFRPDHLYDLVFVDAAKSQYKSYLEHFFPYVRRNGYFVFDNLGFHGMVVHKIGKFREELLQDPRFETAWYEKTGDGIAVAKKVTD